MRSRTRSRRTLTRGSKRLAPPPAGWESIDPAFAHILPGERLIRVYRPRPHRTRPAGFRFYGPLERFDHQRTAAGSTVGTDRARGVLYAGWHPTCCIGEHFGDRGSIVLAGRRIARLDVVERLDLVDLRGTKATGIGTTQGIGAVGERAVTQAWGRYLYEHPQTLHAHGLVYTAFHSGMDAVALWESARSALRWRRGQSWDLADRAVWPDVQLASGELHLPIFG